MSTQVKRRWSALAVLLFSLAFTHAQPPSGIVQAFFDEDFYPVWDLTGTYEVEELAIGPGGSTFPIHFAFDATHEDSGRISGSGVTIIYFGDSPAAGEYTVRGKTSRAGDLTRVTLTIQVRGIGVVAGVFTSYSFSTTQRLDLYPEFDVLFGRSRGSVKLSGIGTGKIRTDEQELAMPAGADGEWLLQADLVPLKKIGGSAAIFFNSGRVIPMRLSGSYSSRNDVTRLKMSGAGPSRGVKVNLSFAGDADELVDLRGKVLGQTLR